MSSGHSAPEIDSIDNQKPTMIIDYNRCKGGVDTFDENIEEFTCRRKTLRAKIQSSARSCLAHTTNHSSISSDSLRD